jgi:hypothetical protein
VRVGVGPGGADRAPGQRRIVGEHLVGRQPSIQESRNSVNLDVGALEQRLSIAAELHLVVELREFRRALLDLVDDAVADVLPALAATFGFRYRTFVRLDAGANETYSGSLGEVIARLLDGCSYVIKKDRDAFELVVVGGNGGQPIAVQAPPAEPGKTIASQWR